MNRERDAKGRLLPTHGMCKASTYQIWNAMLRRCGNPKDPNYSRYGGRGITVCDRWKDFRNFLTDLGERPEGMQIDRRNNDQGYFPENTRWVSPKENARNRRDNRLIKFRGETRCLAAWCEILNISRKTLHKRIKYLKWSIERALTEPIHNTGSHNNKQPMLSAAAA